MEAKKLEGLTVSEYLLIEQESDTKYEFENGRIYAQAGGSYNHSMLCGNIFGEIRSGLRSKKSDCIAFTSEMKVQIDKANSYVYPDAMVVCGEVERPKEAENSVSNPKLIVEVLSKSTSNYDRGAKFHKYGLLKSLSEYLLIEQNEVAVELYSRVNDLWKITRIEGIDAKIRLESIGTEIELSQIYEGVNL